MEHPNPTIFCSLDLEMAQPSGNIIQIGAVFGNIETGEILQELSLIVNPHEQLSEFIVNLTGITQEAVDGGMELAEAYKLLKEAHIANKAFTNPITWGGGDSEAIRQQIGGVDERYIFGRRWIDAKTLHITWCLANGIRYQSGLAKSMLKHGFKFDGRKHDALDDARNTFLIYRHLLGKFKNL
jgi:inhibitor of KinA sporulation pathway (predicted exonuclease)